MNIEDEIDNNIELYFFDPNKEKDDFIELYKELKNERYSREKGYRYSPLYIIQKDIRHCLGARRYFYHIPKQQRDNAPFAAAILIYTAFDNLVKKYYSDNFPGFAKKFMKIGHSDYKIIKKLRNALIHNNYSLFSYSNGIKYYFSLGIRLEKFIEEVSIQTSYPSKMYRIDIRKLKSAFENGTREFKEYLLDRKNKKARKLFIDNFDVDTWMFLYDNSTSI